MIRRSTLVLLTCLGALSVSIVPGLPLPAESAVSAQSAPLLLAQADEGSASNVLSIGSRGRAVSALQNRLKETGYYDGEVDGLYGLGTQRAVLAFQEAQGFEPTGRLDNPTWEALEAFDGSSSDPAESSEDTNETAVPSDAADAEVPPVGEREASTPVVEERSGGLGKVLWGGIGLAALAASFGVGFFIANKSKLEAAEEELEGEWGEVDPQVGLPDGAAQTANAGSLPLQNGASANGFGGTTALAAMGAPLGANGLSSAGQLGGTSPLAPTDVVDGLIKDLHNPDPSQRRKVIWELGQRGNSIAVQPLVDAMVSADSKEKSLVLAALSEIGIRSLKPMNRALAIALKDDNPEVRKNAIRDLTRIYDLVIQISQMLGHATEDEDPEVRQTAAWALDQLNRLRRNQDIDTNMRSFNAGSGPNRFAS